MFVDLGNGESTGNYVQKSSRRSCDLIIFIYIYIFKDIYVYMYKLCFRFLDFLLSI